MIPFMDLSRQYNLLKDEILKKISEVCEKRDFILGSFVEKFENSFAKWTERRFCIGCSSGTTALSLALEATGIKEGDEVITTPLTFIATAEAICHIKAKPVFADIDPLTLNLSPEKVKEKITKKTKAIIPVHLYGSPADMNSFVKIAKEHNLIIIEDCAQSHGAVLNGYQTGSFGKAGAFSFFPGKNLGAFGDAGAVVTDDQNLDFLIKKLRNHGRTEKYVHDIIGYNHRMDGIQAAILEVKLKYLSEWITKRRRIAKMYDTLLKDIKKPVVLKEAQSAYHLYVILVKEREKVQKALKEKGIETAVHYPVPLHLQPAFSFLGYKKNDLPIAEKAAEEVLSIPFFPEMTDEEIYKVAESINSVV